MKIDHNVFALYTDVVNIPQEQVGHASAAEQTEDEEDTAEEEPDATSDEQDKEMGDGDEGDQSVESIKRLIIGPS